MDQVIEDIIGSYRPGSREDLIPILQEIQEKSGYIPEEAIIKVGKMLGLSTTKIYGLATFYDQFRFIPAGKVHLRICRGTSCFLNGAEHVIRKIREELGIEPGQTTRDGSFSYDIVTCMGGCTNGPVIFVNGEFVTNVRPEKIPELISKLKYSLDVA